MEAKTIVGILVVAIGAACLWLTRSNHKPEAAAVMLIAGSALVVDDFFAPGVIPGNWGLTGAAAASLGLKLALDWRSESLRRAQLALRADGQER